MVLGEEGSDVIAPPRLDFGIDKSREDRIARPHFVMVNLPFERREIAFFHSFVVDGVTLFRLHPGIDDGDQMDSLR